MGFKEWRAAINGRNPHLGEPHPRPCCFCGGPITQTETEPCRVEVGAAPFTFERYHEEYVCHEACLRATMKDAPRYV